MNFDNQIILENDLISLSPLSHSHLDKLLPFVLSNPDLLKYSPSPFGTTKAFEAYIKKAISARNKKERYPFVIFDKKSNQYIGSSSYGKFSFENQRLEIGWTWIFKEFQGAGINSQAKFLLLDYAFHQLKMVRVVFKTDVRNVASRKALEKIGATLECILRSHTVLQDGYRRDTAVYSILKEEWIEIYKSRKL
ncbi:MAG: GNAT family N-acetyltransferase [Fluviicola sp.]|nr:MAG: GNAT family N-acetyltransferase [Fluviicola sp.]